MSNERLQAHDTYYMDGRMIVLSCGGRLFRILYWHLEKYCPALLRLAEPGSDSETDGTRGTSDDTAIPIGDNISAEEFAIFLDFFYRGILRREIPVEEWCRLLVISSKLDCKEVRVRAIDELTAKKAKLSSIDRIELGNKYDVPQWLPEAYADVFVRESHLAAEEGEKLGLEITVKILEGRDRCKKNGWSHSDDNNVIQLANEIFPPPNRAVAPRRRGGRFAGRLVYGGPTQAQKT